jgi:hypothetical protein
VLWWFIGAWLGVSAIVPIMWLLSTNYPELFSPDIEAQKQVAPEPHVPASWRVSSFQVGRYAFSGLLSIGVLILLFIGSFDDPPVMIRGLTSSLTGAPAMPSQMASIGPMPAPMSAPLSDAKLQMEPAQAEAISQKVEAEHEVRWRSEAGHIAADETQSDSYKESAKGSADHQMDAAAAPVSVAVTPPSAPMLRKERVWTKQRTVRAPPRPDIRRSYGTWLWPANQDARG